MKTSAAVLIIACLAALTVPSAGHAAPHYYHPQNNYAKDNNREGIAVSVDIDSGSTTQTYDVPLRKAGLPVKMSLTADETEEECDYKIAFQGKRYRFIRDTCIWSTRLDRNLELFLFDAGMEYAPSANYLDKHFRFSVIAMQNGAPTERQCAIVPGDKLGLGEQEMQFLIALKSWLNISCSALAVASYPQKTIDAPRRGQYGRWIPDALMAGGSEALRQKFSKILCRARGGY